MHCLFAQSVKRGKRWLGSACVLKLSVLKSGLFLPCCIAAVVVIVVVVVVGGELGFCSLPVG